MVPAATMDLPRRRRSHVRITWKDRLRALPRPNFLERRSGLDPAVYLIAALSIASSAVLGSLYCPSYEVSVDGVSLGRVNNRQVVESAIHRVEARASSILDHPYTLEQTVSYDFGISLREDLIPVARVETYLFDQIGEVMKTSVLTVNGQMIGAADDEAALTTLLDSLKAPYVNDNTISAEFTQPVVVTKEYTSTSALKDVASMRQVLTANSMEQVDYTVQAGDTFSGIANSHDMRMADLQALNPEVDINKLWVGQTLTISQAVPFLSVRTVDNLTYDGPVAYPVEEVPNDSMYQGDTKVTEQGEDGVARVTADVTYVNGYETERTVISTTTLQEATTTHILRGTKEKPRTASTGSYSWPCSGTITSRYGYRSRGFHTGLDIAVPYGTAIKAADGGTVTFAGRQGGYGNLVIITHDNGSQTYYAHNSSLVVSVGDKVYKGQTVAKAGSTGNSTGNHCHFEIRIGGKTVNPLNYLG